MNWNRPNETVKIKNNNKYNNNNYISKNDFNINIDDNFEKINFINILIIIQVLI